MIHYENLYEYLAIAESVSGRDSVCDGDETSKNR
jgi:hypothetical protein